MAQPFKPPNNQVNDEDQDDSISNNSSSQANLKARSCLPEKEAEESPDQEATQTHQRLPRQHKCMSLNQLLYERSTGALGTFAFQRHLSTRLLYTFQAAPFLEFNGGERGFSTRHDAVDESGQRIKTWAHQAGLSSLAIDKYEGRLLLSGGQDGTIRIWDLEERPADCQNYSYGTVGQMSRSRNVWPVDASKLATGNYQGHAFGVTHLAFHPWDSNTFLSSSYDGTLKVCATATASCYQTYNLGAKVYTHAASPIATESVLVACATQSPAARLVDLRTKAAVQSLISPGQVSGAVLSVAWSPRHEHTLATGSTNGTVCIWDIRRGNALVGLLDKEDSLGIMSRGGNPAGATLAERGIRTSAIAHAGPVNALSWTDDGSYIVSAGHDRKINVWDAESGANTLVNFGPTLRNGGVHSLDMIVSPSGTSVPKGELLFWPNETEVVVFGLHEGSVITRLRGLGALAHNILFSTGSQRSSWNTVTSIAYRAGGGYKGSSGVVMGGRDSIGGLYTGHGDGQIRVWMPKKEGRDDEDEDLTPKQAVETKSRKRKALDDVFRSMTGRQITFS